MHRKHIHNAYAQALLCRFHLTLPSTTTHIRTQLCVTNAVGEMKTCHFVVILAHTVRICRRRILMIAVCGLISQNRLTAPPHFVDCN